MVLIDGHRCLLKRQMPQQAVAKVLEPREYIDVEASGCAEDHARVPLTSVDQGRLEEDDDRLAAEAAVSYDLADMTMVCISSLVRSR